MAFAVATMKKLKVENLKGLERHNQRETQKHENVDIDTSRSHLNYDLVNDNSVNYQKAVMGYIEQNRKSTRAVRKDAVVADEWIIGSDQKYFKTLSAEDTRRFFEESQNYFGQKFGANNIRYAMVHMDETTPHMHMGIVPLTADGRLSSKTVFDRKTLKQVQDEFPKFMQTRGFNLERGHEDGKRKSLTVPEFKQANQQKIADEQELKKSLVQTTVTLIPDVSFVRKDTKERVKFKDSVEYFLQKSVEELQKIVAIALEYVQKTIKKQQEQLKKEREKQHEQAEKIQSQERQISNREQAIIKSHDYMFLAQDLGADTSIFGQTGRGAKTIREELASMSDEELIKRDLILRANAKQITHTYDREMLLKAADKLGVQDRLIQVKERLKEQEKTDLGVVRRSNGFRPIVKKPEQVIVKKPERVINLDKHPELRERYPSFDNDFQQKGPQR